MKKTAQTTEDSLAEWRQQLDLIDDQMIDLLAKRMTYIGYIGKYKKDHDIVPLDPKRWKAVMTKRLKKAKEHNLSEAMVKDLYETIHHHALLHEEKV